MSLFPAESRSFYFVLARLIIDDADRFRRTRKQAHFRLVCRTNTIIDIERFEKYHVSLQREGHPVSGVNGSLSSAPTQ
jgi:hypothetical protein